MSLVTVGFKGFHDDLFIVIRIERVRNSKLSKVGYTHGPFAFLLGRAQSRQKQGRQNGDDGDYDQQFDESEPVRQGTYLPRFH